MSVLSRRTLLGSLAAAALAARGSCAWASPSPSRLKITKFVLHKATVRWRDLMILEIHTDGGLVGIGEASLHTRVDVVEAALRWLEPRMVGLDPAGVEEHWNRNYYGLTRWRGGPVLVTALSAVDIALHDLEGKRLGVPVWRLLGGAIHRQLRAYYTHWDTAVHAKSPKQFAEQAAATQQKGWTAVKFAIEANPSQQQREQLAVARLAAIREAAGPALDIGLELWESMTVRSALSFAQAVAPYKPMFLEEPLQRENPLAFTELAAKSPVPIAAGEGLLSRYEFRQLLEAKGATIIQPDVLHCGGITELRKIANLAEAFGVEVAPHQCYGPIAHAASLAAMSVCRNFFIHEWEAEDEPLFVDLTRGTFPVQKNGCIPLPQGAGLGIDLNVAELVRRFPYKPAA